MDSRKVKTMHFICTQKWFCPLCYKETRINRVKCDECKKDMGISRFAFEKRLKGMMPITDYDNHDLVMGTD